MNRLFTDASFNSINLIAGRYGVSTNAVTDLTQTLMFNNGTMAQFNIFELGGSGQWMQGGMTMVGDMFNNQLKNTVNGLCGELSSLIQQGLIQYKPLPKTPDHINAAMATNWWGDLGYPNATGSQNDTRYAIFSNIGRLAIQENGKVTIFNTLDHQIGGVGQQQSGSYTVSFTSQYGLVDLSTLPVILPDGTDVAPEVVAPFFANDAQVAQVAPQETNPVTLDNDAETAIFNTIERLAALKDKGMLTDEEITNKKIDLLNRL